MESESEDLRGKIKLTPEVASRVSNELERIKEQAGDEEKSPWYTKYIIPAVILFLSWIFFAKPLIGRFWGVPEIGHIFEKNRPYESTYYVNLFPEDAQAKNYRLNGNITVSNECGSDEDPCFTVINLNYVRWPNSGASYFEDCDISSGEKEFCSDDQGRQWGVELTDQRVR